MLQKTHDNERGVSILMIEDEKAPVSELHHSSHMASLIISTGVLVEEWPVLS